MKSKLCMVCLTCFTIWKGSIMKFEKLEVVFYSVCVFWFVSMILSFFMIDKGLDNQLIQSNMIVLSISFVLAVISYLFIKRMEK